MRRLAAIALVSVLALATAQAPATGTPWWRVPAEPNRDLPPGLIPYHRIAPALRDIAQRSNRVQVEVIGESVQGRDLYLVTVADPQSFGKFGRYQQLRRLMLRDPVRAQRRIAEYRDFKVPVFVNGSIHGNEWEGVDASIRLIRRLAFDNDAETKKVLANTIVLFNVVQNPDGRVLGQRQNANGFDLNRDFITLSQPEVRATVEQIVEWNPMVLLDLHGYVNPMLIEPATPPHNPNYEYDLYIKWALRQAEAMEDRLAAETGLPAVIPFRDWEDGWDDWPPIFTPMYAMYHGSYGHTLESPMRVNGSAVSLPPEERRQRAETNVRAHMATSWGAMLFASENKRAMVHDQIEVFRRGWLDEPQVPIGDTYGEEHEFIAEFPEAYVIPMGAGQRSETSAIELVNHLLVNDVVVRRATRAFRVNGTTYPAGSYVVPMRQPKRGLANTILEPGWDISDVVPVMYDISGWSLGELWGATVHSVPDGTPVRATTAPVRSSQEAAGSVEAGRAPRYALLVNSPAAVRAVNELLDVGVDLWRSDDGRVFIPSSARTHIVRLANSLGLTFTRASALPVGAEPLERVDVAAAAGSDEYFVLTGLGFH
ncbi:MAG: peptidase M28, partial [Actinomycetota bacterium]|nr:peptidase M28 [Actinomycetota bacterium]